MGYLIEPRGYLCGSPHVNFFIKWTVQISGFHIKMLYNIVISSYNAEYEMDEFYCTKGVKVHVKSIGGWKSSSV